MENQTNSIDALDLYAKVEDLLGLNEAMTNLYIHYIKELQNTNAKTLLDVGCGSGAFLQQVSKSTTIKVMGIDLSPLMITRTKALSIEAYCTELCKLEGKFDVITAAFDMLNYLDSTELVSFMACVEERLTTGGIFVCDINTLFGFEEVAVGAYIAEDEKCFLAIESAFEAAVYTAHMTLFEVRGQHFTKSQANITQHYHSKESIEGVTGLKLLRSKALSLYGFEEADKSMLVFKKEGC